MTTNYIDANNNIQFAETALERIALTASTEEQEILAHAIEVLIHRQKATHMAYEEYVEVRAAFAKVLNTEGVSITCGHLARYHSSDRILMNYDGKAKDIKFYEDRGFCTYGTQEYIPYIVSCAPIIEVTTEKGWMAMRDFLKSGKSFWGEYYGSGFYGDSNVFTYDKDSKKWAEITIYGERK